MRPDPQALAYRRLVEPIPGGAGLLALVGLWVAYLLPQRVRHRDQLLEARSDDRYSGSMRILAVARPARSLEAEVRDCPPGQRKHHQLLTGAMPTVSAAQITGARGAQDMDRPTTGAQRTVAPTARASSAPAGRGPVPRAAEPARDARQAAAAQARRAALAEQRAAAASRRLALTLTLLAASAIAWTAVSAFSLPIVVPMVLTTLLGGVLVLGRRAVLASKRADAASAPRSSARPTAQPRASVTGRAVHGSETSTQMISSDAVRVAVEATAGRTATAAPSIAERSVTAADAATTDVADALDGTPALEESHVGSAAPAAAAPIAEGGELRGFSLPRPTYTMKAAAPRREPAPLEDADVTTPANAAQRAASASATSAEEPVSTATDGLGADLDAILARRRASGQ